MKTESMILNTNVITEDGILENQAVVIEGDRIRSIVPMNLIGESDRLDGSAEIYDGEGAYLAPGFIDVHSDNIETIVQPRPKSLFEFEIAVREHEKQLVNQGVTTMYHSISFMGDYGGVWNTHYKNKAARHPQHMERLVELIHNLQYDSHIIRHKYHCRFDIRNVDGLDTLYKFFDNDYIHLLSFMDHTPGQGQYRDLEKYRQERKKEKPELDDKQFDKILEERLSVPMLSFDVLEQIAEKAWSKGIPIATHDDDSIEKIDYVSTKLKAVISEFPVELKVARKAKERKMYVVAGAPNILLGKSHSGNMPAIEGILDGCVDILCSDYFPPALLHAVFKLNHEYRIPLWESLKMVTLNPAKALGIAEDFGSVREGKKADLVMIKILDGRPVITKVFIDGIMVSGLTYRNNKEKNVAK